MRPSASTTPTNAALHAGRTSPLSRLPSPTSSRVNSSSSPGALQPCASSRVASRRQASSSCGEHRAAGSCSAPRALQRSRSWLWCRQQRRPPKAMHHQRSPAPLRKYQGMATELPQASGASPASPPRPAAAGPGASSAWRMPLDCEEICLRVSHSSSPGWGRESLLGEDWPSSEEPCAVTNVPPASAAEGAAGSSTAPSAPSTSTSQTSGPATSVS
mmetsp:Transcript_25823/g.81541  ORF Transcript_25823/g.81541 Transcript_25823/m.81541 type:complete len:216 (-) Transcript_25823:818-1465(-)